MTSEHKPDASPSGAPTSYRKTIAALVAVIVVYLGLLVAGLPQKWTAAQFAPHGSRFAAVVAHPGDENASETTGVSAEAGKTSEKDAAEPDRKSVV